MRNNEQGKDYGYARQFWGATSLGSVNILAASTISYVVLETNTLNDNPAYRWSMGLLAVGAALKGIKYSKDAVSHISNLDDKKVVFDKEIFE
ncbi:hypothetical protein KBC51_01330 [Candidatus Saccharibacteria bacterium]|jgi:hypothetical protein|nr:hypothetical protein [Candidatus Saccharibacteria bacterium]